jgi:hypothetical protein
VPSEVTQLIGEMPEAYERFRAPLRERRGYRWVQEIFRRHRQRGGAGALESREQGAAHAGHIA